MHIYIDESGSFAVPKHGKRSIACVGALTLTERWHAQFEAEFDLLKQRWGFEGKEVKGRELVEAQIAEFILLMRRCEAKLHVCATDMAQNPTALVNTAKRDQATSLLANLTKGHQRSLVQQVSEIAKKMASLSPQLYVQYCLMNALIYRQLHDVIIHYAMKEPSALGAFRWVIDAKGKDITIMEDLWKILLPPFLQDRSLKWDPIIQVLEGDYSRFERFYTPLTEWQVRLPGAPNKKAGEMAIDIKRIMWDSFEFQESGESLGLQAADIAISTFRRGLMGTLRFPSWAGLGNLMLRWREPAVLFLLVRPTSAAGDRRLSNQFVRQVQILNSLAQPVV